MSTLLDGVRRYVKRTRGFAPIAPNDDYRRGYLQGLRRYYAAGHASADDNHAHWLVLPDSPEHAEFDRGYRDGLAGTEPQSWGPAASCGNR
jgi:hypothetical protein